MRANEVRVFQIVNWRQNPHYTHRPQQQKRTEPAFNLWFENGAAWYPSRLFADNSKIPHFVRDSPANSDAPQPAQLAEKIRSLYTGKLLERIHYLGSVLAAWATMKAGRV